MRFFCFLSVALISLANVAFATEQNAEALDPKVEELRAMAKSYGDSRNLSKFLEASPDPIAALNEIAKEATGDYAQELTKNYVAYEEATGTRDLSSSQKYSEYYDEANMEKFADFYGLNGGNAENTGVPYTANNGIETAEEYLPAMLANNPELVEKLMKDGVTSTKDVAIEPKKLEALARKTKLDPQTIKFILKGMNTGKVTSPALIKALPSEQDGASNFVRQSFANEIADAKRIKGSADKSFADYKLAMDDYNKYITNMRSDQFREQFKEYAKYFKSEQSAQAMSPYINQAKERLDKAKLSYDQAFTELKNLQVFLDRVQKQKIEPAANKYMQSIRTSAVLNGNSSGVYGFAAAAAAGSAVPALDSYGINEAFAKELSPSALNTSVSATSSGFEVGITNFGNNSTGSTRAVNSINQPINTTEIATKDTRKALLISFMAGSGSEPSPMPTNSLTRRWLETDSVSGDNYKPLCDGEDKDKTGSARPATRYSPSECVERLHRLTPFGAKTSDYITLIKPTDGRGAKDSGANVGLRETASSNDSLAKLLELKDKGSSSFLKNRAEDSVVLTKGQLNADQATQLDGLEKSGYNVKSAAIDTYAFESKNGASGKSRAAASGGNKEYEPYNTVFDGDEKKAEEQAIEQGYCLMVEDEDGEYNISENSDYVPTYDPYSDPDFDPAKETRHKKYNMGGGKSASVVRITAPEHPFSPRHKAEWVDMNNTLPSVTSNMCSGKKMTDVCGTDEKDNLNAYAWEPIANGWSSGPVKDYGYYKKGILDHDGKIYSNPTRTASYTAIGGPLFWVVYYYTEDSDLACDVAEHAACQIAILPDVEMDNKLALAYTKAQAGEGSSSSSSGGGGKGLASSKSRTSSDENLPTLYTDANDSFNTKGYESNGLDYKKSLPEDKFEFNGPYVESWASKIPAPKEAEDMDYQDLAPYMLTVAGMNGGYSMSEDNSKKPEARDMRCGTGGWKALVRYQETCSRVAGVNCICDYQKALFKETAWAYVQDRASGVGQSIDNKERSTTITEKVNGQELSREEDTTARLNFVRRTMASRDGYPINAMANYKVGGDDSIKFPGKGKKGLGNAKANTIIVMQEPVGDELKKPNETLGQFKRPWMAAWVESVDPNNGCILASTKNAHSVFLDSCGNSENLGKVSSFYICPPNSNAAGFNYPGGSAPSCAKNSEYETCVEDMQGWNSWTVYNPFPDNQILGSVINHTPRVM